MPRRAVLWRACVADGATALFSSRTKVMLVEARRERTVGVYIQTGRAKRRGGRACRWCRRRMGPTGGGTCGGCQKCELVAFAFRIPS
ncbi:hypothetical protein B0H13DRAFT_2060309 [Mycena leptocephala]|nr:hypothetical protein B0H13DRAFT_2060309 [Mycena leptocephala]